MFMLTVTLSVTWTADTHRITLSSVSCSDQHDDPWVQSVDCFWPPAAPQVNLCSLTWDQRPERYLSVSSRVELILVPPTDLLSEDSSLLDCPAPVCGPGPPVCCWHLPHWGSAVGPAPIWHHPWDLRIWWCHRCVIDPPQDVLQGWV